LIPKELPIGPYYKKQDYEQAVKYIREKKVDFEDVYFTLENKNIKYVDREIKLNKLLLKSDIDKISKYNFTEISNLESYKNYFESTPVPQIDLSLFTSRLGRSSVTFGEFGNINLYNCIIFLMQKENWLGSLIGRMDLRRKLFVIKLYIQGKPKRILIDEYIPTSLNEKNEIIPAFIFDREQFWISIVEKAYAKINRSYGNCIRSLASEIFPIFSEAPMKKIKHTLLDSKKIWEYLQEGIQNKHIIFAEFDTYTNELYTPEIFISFFIYNIFRVGKNRYVELIIPESDSGDKEKNLTSVNKFISKIKQIAQEKISKEDIKKNTLFTDKKLKSSKIIFMNLEHYYNFFISTFILKQDSDYFYNFKKFKNTSSEFNLAKIKISETTKIFLTLHLKQNKFFIKQNNYNVPLSRIIVSKIKFTDSQGNFQGYSTSTPRVNNTLSHPRSRNTYANTTTYFNSTHTQPNLISMNETISGAGKNYITTQQNSFREEALECSLEYVESIFGKEEKQTLELELEPGVYYIFFKVYSDVDFNLVLSTYADKDTPFEDNLNEFDLKIISSKSYLTHCINEIFCSYLEKGGVIQSVMDELEMFYSFSLTDSNLGFSILRIENNSNDKILYFTCSYEIQGMTLISHERKKIKEKYRNGHFKNQVSVPICPQCKEFIIFEWTNFSNEVSINVKPLFKVDLVKPKIMEYDFFNKPKTFITNDIFYYEMTFSKGVFIVIVNESPRDFNIFVEFEKMSNLYIIYPQNYKNQTALELFLKSKCKNFITMKMNNSQEISYKFKFRLKRVGSRQINEIKVR
jgi:hypothetical protein